MDLQCNSWKLNSAIGILKSSRNDYKFHYSRRETIFLVALFIDLIEAKWQKTIYRHIICLVKYYTNMKKFDQYFFFRAYISLCSISVLSSHHHVILFLCSFSFWFSAFLFSPRLSFPLLSVRLSLFTPNLYNMQNWIYIFFKWHWLENAMNSQRRWGWMRQRKQ